MVEFVVVGQMEMCFKFAPMHHPLAIWLSFLGSEPKVARAIKGLSPGARWMIDFALVRCLNHEIIALHVLGCLSDGKTVGWIAACEAALPPDMLREWMMQTAELHLAKNIGNDAKSLFSNSNRIEIAQNLVRAARSEKIPFAVAGLDAPFDMRACLHSVLKTRWDCQQLLPTTAHAIFELPRQMSDYAEVLSAIEDRRSGGCPAIA